MTDSDYMSGLERENTALKARVAAFETGLEAEITQRVEALDSERRANFDNEVSRRATAIMAKVGQPVPVSADVSGSVQGAGSQTGADSRLTGLARAVAFFRAKRESSST